jgi:hypothetical protein
MNDSKLSLDAGDRKRDSVTMIAQPYQLYVERTDRTRNMSRFYAMSIEPNLFGEACLGSGLIDQSQKITVAARAMAERKTIGHLS